MKFKIGKNKIFILRIGKYWTLKYFKYYLHWGDYFYIKTLYVGPLQFVISQRVKGNKR
jgi:hypothetical protein